MGEIAIHAEGLSKRYRIGASWRGETLRQALSGGMRAGARRLVADARGRVRGGSRILWALRDVDLDVARGEVVGLVGRNGAGKSTLLKILSRITRPTSGRAVIRGRVGSLLEVGTGFHPELTGRDNVYLNGAVLGMRRAEIARKFDEIVAFAGTEAFLDTPVKRYSSGMYTRLAFAVAAHLEPEILLVDEVLAVGDAAFQKKCLGKMNDIATQGRTVIFVSHNVSAVQRLCDRAVWLDEGRVVDSGAVDRVVAAYLDTTLTLRTTRLWDDPAAAPGTEDLRIRAARVRPVGGEPGDRITIRTPFRVELDTWAPEGESRVHPVFRVFNASGVLLFDAAAPAETRAARVGTRRRDTCVVPGDVLNDGVHRVEVLLTDDRGATLFRLDELLTFQVLDSELSAPAHSPRRGAVRPPVQWIHETVDESASTLPASLHVPAPAEG